MFSLWMIYLISSTITLAQPHFITYFCVDNDNYTINSTYKGNLDSTLSSLPVSNSGFGFFNLSTGQGNDTVNSAALCRGDIEPVLCMSCLNDLIIKLPEVCPNQKEAVGYYNDCLLKYSNASVLRNIDRVDKYVILVNPQSAPDRFGFVMSLGTLMNKLIDDAAAGGSLLKVAIGNTTGPDFLTIYGLAQCTPDLSRIQCRDCLVKAYGHFTTHNYIGRIGGTIFLSTCRYSYGLNRYFNASLPEPPGTP